MRHTTFTTNDLGKASRKGSNRKVARLLSRLYPAKRSRAWADLLSADLIDSLANDGLQVADFNSADHLRGFLRMRQLGRRERA